MKRQQPLVGASERMKGGGERRFRIGGQVEIASSAKDGRFWSVAFNVELKSAEKPGTEEQQDRQISK